MKKILLILLLAISTNAAANAPIGWHSELLAALYHEDIILYENLIDEFGELELKNVIYDDDDNKDVTLTPKIVKKLEKIKAYLESQIWLTDIENAILERFSEIILKYKNSTSSRIASRPADLNTEELSAFTDPHMVAIRDLTEITRLVGSHTLVVFDIDDTLITDEETTDISSIVARTEKIMYLTARKPRYADKTRNKLKRRGVLASDHWLPEELKGMHLIFTGKGSQLFHKGPYLLEALDQLFLAGVYISNVIFVDDRPSQVRSVVDYLWMHDIPYLGVVFEKYVKRDERDKKRRRYVANNLPQELSMLLK